MNKDFILSSYDFELPESMIAARPVSGRHHSKLLVYNAKTGEVTHSEFLNLANFLPQDSLIVFNQSKVFPCRLMGTKPSGGKAEIFILSLVSHNETYECLVRTTSKKKIGDVFHLPEGVIAKIEGLTDNGSFYLSFSTPKLIDFLEHHGIVPIPPYIRGGVSDEQDKTDYQTLYAKEKGSVAAPTAGLHFTPEVFKCLDSKNIKRAFVTLHVGAGTFAPVKAENILEHKMHNEEYFVEHDNLELIKKAKYRFAVGTTSLRVLESSINSNKEFTIDPEKHYHTDIFLYPGKEVHSIDGLITNFHLPKSTLLMLVSTLVGREKTLELYEIAKKNHYRFFSYGDAMLILR